MHICTSIQYSVPNFNKKLNIKKHATFFGKRISKLKSTQKITKETVFILTRYFQKNICIGKLHCVGTGTYSIVDLKNRRKKLRSENRKILNLSQKWIICHQFGNLIKPILCWISWLLKQDWSQKSSNSDVSQLLYWFVSVKKILMK